ncbi:unnamed protein product [Rotaria sp. Silwood1]|nr:unnamed protein product [Rotaria sp. Silwood1]
MDKYIKLNRIGKGAYGTVYKCKHVQSDEIVALKRVHLHMKSPSEEGVPNNIIREIKALQEIEDHENIVKLLDVFPHGMGYIFVFEYMLSDLSEVIRNVNQPLTTSHIKSYMRMQDSSMLLFTPSYRNQIKKTISNQMDKSLTSSKYSNVSNLNRTKENRNKRSSLSFFLFDSIFSHSVTKSLTTNTKYEQSSKRSYSSLYPQSSLISNIQLSEQTYSSYNNNNNNNVIKEDEYVQLLNTNKDNN